MTTKGTTVKTRAGTKSLPPSPPAQRRTRPQASHSDKADRKASGPATSRVTLSELVRAHFGRHAMDNSVRLSLNARRQTQIEVTVRTDEDNILTIDEASVKAQAIYDELVGKYARGEVPADAA